MTHTKPTPGPWRVGDAGATVFGPNLGAPSPETIAAVRKKANARLIAAAPELLAALRDTLSWLERSQDYCDGFAGAMEAVTNARAVIAKAKDTGAA